MAKKKSEEKEPNAERWLLSYADFITLLTVFFIIMYSMSKVNAQKFNQMVTVMEKSFGGQHSVIKMANSGLLPQITRSAEMRRKEKQLYVKTVGQLQKEISSKSVRITEDERGIVVSLASDFFFGSGKADLGDSTEAVLKKLTGLFESTKGNIRIEGHTDDIPIVQGSSLAGRMPTNWELSSQRAVNVLKCLEKIGLDRKRLSAAAFADTRPVKPNDTYEGRSFNRRVEIVIMPEGAK
jgi:chemotaxis protein MotB